MVILAALVYLINIIWFVRNEARFNEKRTNRKSAISRVIASTSLIGSHTSKASNNSIIDFTLLKNLKATINNPKSPSILEVVYHPPMQSWIKCNTDGASNGNPGMSSCGGIFRNHEATCIFYFAEALRNSTSYLTKLCGAMNCIVTHIYREGNQVEDSLTNFGLSLYSFVLWN